MARNKRVQTKGPIYEATSAYGYGNRPRMRMGGGTPSWAWGCMLLGVVGCLGVCVLSVLALPVGFRLLAPEYQDAVIRHFPIMSIFAPGNVIVDLPTVDPARATNDAKLLSASGNNTNNTASNTGSSGNSGSPSLAQSALTMAALASTTGTPTPVVAPSPTVQYAPLPAQFHVTNAKWTPQGWNNCGPANLVQTLHILGLDQTQQDVAKWLKPNTNDANVSPWQIAAYTNQFTPFHALVRVNGDFTTLKRLLYAGFGVMIETGYYETGKPQDAKSWDGHYLTIAGWNDGGGFFYGLDSLKSNGPNDEGIHEGLHDLDQRWLEFNRIYIVIYPPDQESKVQDILGNSFDETGNAQAALTHAQQEANDQPNNAFNWFNVGSDYLVLKQWPLAAAAYDRARTSGLPWRMLWYQFGPYKAYFETGDYQTVIDLASTTLKSTADVEETFYYRGTAYAALGANDPALNDLQRALQFNGNFAPASTAIQSLQNGTKPVPHTLVISDAE